MFKRWEFLNTEGAPKGILEKKALLKILQNSQENTCARVYFSIKLQPSGLQLLLKKTSGTVAFL